MPRRTRCGWRCRRRTSCWPPGYEPTRGDRARRSCATRASTSRRTSGSAGSSSPSCRRRSRGKIRRVELREAEHARTQRSPQRVLGGGLPGPKARVSQAADDLVPAAAAAGGRRAQLSADDGDDERQPERRRTRRRRGWRSPGAPGGRAPRRPRPPQRRRQGGGLGRAQAGLPAGDHGTRFAPGRALVVRQGGQARAPELERRSAVLERGGASRSRSSASSQSEAVRCIGPEG